VNWATASSSKAIAGSAKAIGNDPKGITIVQVDTLWASTI